MTAFALPRDLARARPASILIVVIGLAGLAVMSAAGHGHAQVHPAAHVHPGAQPSVLSLGSAVQSGLMMAAMMLPLAAGAVSLVEERSLRRRRRRAVVEHSAGFALVWFIFGAVAAVVVAPVAAVLGNVVTFAALAVFAFWWQLSFRRRNLMERKSALSTGPASGWRADAATLRAAAGNSVRCVRTCWPLMLALVAAPHIGVVWAWLAAYYYEWLPGPDPHGRLRRLVPAAAYGLIIVAVLASAAVASP